jgi:hypothetical protein
VRASPWLVALDILAVLALTAAAVVLARRVRLGDVRAAVLAWRGLVAALHVVAGIGFLATPLRLAASRRRVPRQSAGAVLRGVGVALPVVAVLAALLASADTIFASMFRLHVPLPNDAGAHVALVLFGAVGVGGLLRAASGVAAEPVAEVHRRLGAVEWTVVLASVAALYGAFAIVQLVTLAGGGRHVLETKGLTYAEYARSGYFQLVAAVAFTALVVGVLAAFADRAGPRLQRRWVVLTELVVALTLVLLFVAIRRLGLYEDAYGWTMLRLMAKAGAVWLGVVLVLLAARLAGLRAQQAWFLPAAAAAALAVLITLNVVDPESAIVRHNLADPSVELDPAYLATLSDDAVPALLDRLDRLPAGVRSSVVVTVCDRVRDTDGLSWSWARARARDACDRSFM